MGHNNGLITAPVSVADVATVLGENSSDIGTLCMSENINPVSIICPRYTMSPGLKVEDFDSLKDTGVVGATGTGSGVSYKSPKWGVFLPKVNVALNGMTMFQSAVASWHINRPTATTMKSLHHFAGYKHNADVENPIRSYQFRGGNPIAVTFYTPAREDVLENGGSLSVANILDSGYFGCTVFEQPESVGSGLTATNTGISFISSTSIAESTKATASERKPTTVKVTTTVMPVSGKVYAVIPWISDLPPKNGAVDVDANVYTLRLTDKLPPAYRDQMTVATQEQVGIDEVIYADSHSIMVPGVTGSAQVPGESYNAIYVLFRVSAAVAATFQNFRVFFSYRKTTGEVVDREEIPSSQLTMVKNSQQSASKGLSIGGAVPNGWIEFKFPLPDSFQSEIQLWGVCDCAWNGQEAQQLAEVEAVYED